MNVARKKRLEQAAEIISAVRDEEQAAFDNLPDSFQYGEQGDRMTDAIEALEDALSRIEEITNS